MSNITYFIGFDYHKNTVFAYIIDENRKFIAKANLENRKIVILEFIAKHVPADAPVKAVVEACGGNEAQNAELRAGQKHEYLFFTDSKA